MGDMVVVKTSAKTPLLDMTNLTGKNLLNEMAYQKTTA
jgi:hypothetical protein